MTEEPCAQDPGGSPEAAAPKAQERGLTVRAALSGVVIGSVLAPCNIYSGLKIGWAFNMSIAAALLSYGVWQTLHRAAGTPRFGLLENTMNQTAASAAASIASSGLVAPIPALAMVTGQTLSFPLLALWVLSVSLVGVVTAVGLRKQMLVHDALPFPSGVATAQTLKEMYAEGQQAAARVKALLSAATVAGGLKLIDVFVVAIPKLGVSSRGAIPLGGSRYVTLHQLGFVLDPSLLMVGFGAIVGLRAGLSLLVGAVLAWAVVGPTALARGWAHPGAPEPDTFWFGPMVEWLLWPGVAMMVASSLTSFAFSWRSIAAALLPGGTSSSSSASIDPSEVPRVWFRAGVVVAGCFAVATQVSLFDIPAPTALFGVALTFLLAVVAGRVSGETGITPIGAMGKVTQLTFGAIDPGSPASNLMAANVTGGAAAQCADMLHDLKTGLLVGAPSKSQTLAQVIGVVAGSLAGSWAYLVLVPDPAGMLLTDEWPAPAVAAWKAVAEVFVDGTDAMPPGSMAALFVGLGAGVALAVLEKTLPPKLARWVPSAPSLGLAFVLPAYNAISMFLGALLGSLLLWRARSWAERFVVVIAAGLVAGESLAGVTGALRSVLTGG